MPPALPPRPCRAISITASLETGKPYTHPLGNGLKLWFEPIHSGWILRVVPVAGPLPAHDYAELATPPYQSVSPLSLSTDFSFRAQDAVGWNPRRFRYATSAASFARLEQAYTNLIQAGATPPAPLQVELSAQIADAADGKLTILDAKLVPGTADQWKMAGAVSEHFTTTAHTLVEPPDGRSTPLGSLESLRVRVDFLIPAGFRPDPTLAALPHICGTL